MGDTVDAGHFLGTHASQWTTSDIAVILRNNANTDWKLVSQFELMDDATWSDYQAFGFPDRSAMIISAVERDGDPVGCGEGGGFDGEGVLENWAVLRPNG